MMPFQLVHIGTDLLPGYFCINLGSTDILVTEHLAHSFDGNIIIQGNSRGEGMPGDMRGKLSGDAAEVTNFL